MQLLNCVASFTKNRQDLKNVYLTFIRSVLEQSAVVWHSSLTKKNRNDLERVQKVAVRIIMGTKKLSYNEELKIIKLETLEKRRTNLCLRFAKKCLKSEKMKDLFPGKKSCKRGYGRALSFFLFNFIETCVYLHSCILAYLHICILSYLHICA